MKFQKLERERKIIMCMGCGTTFLQSQDRTSPEGLEMGFWLVGLFTWIVILHHFNGRLALPKPSINSKNKGLPLWKKEN